MSDLPSRERVGESLYGETPAATLGVWRPLAAAYAEGRLVEITDDGDEGMNGFVSQLPSSNKPRGYKALADKLAAEPGAWLPLAEDFNGLDANQLNARRLVVLAGLHRERPMFEAAIRDSVLYVRLVPKKETP